MDTSRDFEGYIKRLDSSIVLNYLLDGANSGVLNNRVYSEIIAKIKNHDYLKSIFDSLSTDEKEFLIKIYFSGNNGVEESDSFKSLVKQFIVFEGEYKQEKRFYGFSDFDELFLPIFSEYLSLRTSSAQKNYSVSAISNDLVLLFSLIENSVIKRKLDGELHKNSVDSFIKRSQLASIYGFEKLKSDFSYKIVEILLLILYKNDVILYGDDCYFTNKDSQKTLFKVINKISLLFTELYEQTEMYGAFTIVRSLLDSYTLNDELIDTFNLRENIVVLAWLGSAVYSDGWKKSEIYPFNDEQRGYILPDFSVMLPKEISPKNLLEFFYIGEIVDVDVVYKAEISKEVVINKLSQGVSVDDIITIFKKWGASEHLIKSVNEWAYSFNRVFIDGGYLAVNKDAGDAVHQIKEIVDSITPLDEYKFYKIKENQVEYVKRILTTLGFDIRVPVKEKLIKPTNSKSKFQFLDAIKVNYSPEFDKVQHSGKKYGMYSGTLKKLDHSGISRLVQFAIHMDEKVSILIKGEEEPITITPTEVKLSLGGTVVGKDDNGEEFIIKMDNISLIGVVDDD